MKPSALRIERLLAKVEAEHNARARPSRYVVYEDEYEEAIAKGLPLPRYFFLMPRTLSLEEWEKKYSPPAPAETKCDRTPSDE
jgi:hypothetical protein